MVANGKGVRELFTGIFAAVKAQDYAWCKQRKIGPRALGLCK